MKTILLVTQGCDKNTVDTEFIAGALARRGMRPVGLSAWEQDRGEVDAVVVNTCGFIDDAKRQSIDTILEWAERGGEQTCRPKLIVCGCLSQRHAEDLTREIPEVDAFFGVGAWDQIAGFLERGNGAAAGAIPAPDMRIDARLLRVPLDGEPHRFLKISDGCNQRCTFCSIPSMKGRHRSVPLEVLVYEARGLIAGGTREVNLIAQDLTSYGVDLRGGVRLADLIVALDALEGDFWLRLFYAYPARIDDRLIGTLAEAEHVVPYLDMPLQHASTPVLRRMRRPGGQPEVEALLDRLRGGIPNLVLRTTFIVGFPGETEADFETLLAFVESQRFDRVGAFMYQPQEGTPAAAMPDQVPDEVKRERHHRLMTTQQAIAARNQAERFAGRTLRVLCESFDEECDMWRTRSHADGPEVDGITWVEAAPGALSAGEFAEVAVSETDPYDMRAQLSSEDGARPDRAA
jgi:ribosomal protein S12 methylthiotransferase